MLVWVLLHCGLFSSSVTWKLNDLAADSPSVQVVTKIQGTIFPYFKGIVPDFYIFERMQSSKLFVTATGTHLS